jgi:hypothetical protein
MASAKTLTKDDLHLQAHELSVKDAEDRQAFMREYFKLTSLLDMKQMCLMLTQLRVGIHKAH